MKVLQYNVEKWRNASVAVPRAAKRDRRVPTDEESPMPR